MKIAYLTMDNPHDLSGWSGLTHFIGKSLVDAGNELSYHYGFNIKSSWLLNLKQKLYPKLSGKFIQPNRYPVINNQYTKQLSRKLDNIAKPDFLFSNSSELIAAAPTTIPKAFWVDACFAGMLGYYPEFSILHPETIRKANLLEQKAYDKADVIFFASDWAAQTALKHYQINKHKVKVVPFGANLTTPPTIVPGLKKQYEICRLLFSGVYWERKGGPLAIKIVERLIERGIKVELTIVGCTPFIPKELSPFVKQYGFLNKQNPAEKAQLAAIFENAHFLLLPSQAECYGLVYAEANSYALPAIGTKTGGITTIIKDHVNGITLTHGASTDDYCDFIEQYFSNRALYEVLSNGSFEAYKNRLNWNVAGETVSNYLLAAIS